MRRIGEGRVWMLLMLMCSVNDFEVSVRTAAPYVNREAGRYRCAWRTLRKP